MILNFPEERSKNEILKSINQLEVYKQFVNVDFKYKGLCPFHSDTIPSFSIYRKHYNINFKCFGCGEGGDLIDFISKFKKLSYHQSLKFLEDKNYVGLPVVHHNIDCCNTNNKQKEEKISLILKFQPFTLEDMQYWAQFGIGLNDLVRENIYSLKEAILPNNKIIENKNSLIYYYELGKDRHKFYFPNNPKGKRFISYGSMKNYLEGLELLPKKGDLVIIAKSKKDAVLLRKLGYLAVSIASENTLPENEIIDDLKKRFNRVIIYLDNDIAGLKSAVKASQRYNIPYIYNPIGSKDISDYYKDNKLEKTIELVKNLIENSKNEEIPTEET